MGSCPGCASPEAVIPSLPKPPTSVLNTNILHPTSQPINPPSNLPEQIVNLASNHPSKDGDNRRTKYLLRPKQISKSHAGNQIFNLSNQFEEFAHETQQIQVKAQSKPVIRAENAQIQKFKNMITNNFTIGQQLIEMLDGVCFTENQAIDLFKALINAVHALQQSQDSNERQNVDGLFNQENIELIKNGKLFYYGVLNAFENMLKTKNNYSENQQVRISQQSKSRIYHKIASFRKQNTIQEEYENQFGVQCIKSNDYKKLSQFELDQVVKYESVAQKTKEIGQNISFRYKSIKEESQKINNLLAKCMQKYMEAIKELQYDLSSQQVMKMAAVSRQACIYYDNGVYVLLAYFVQSCKRLQQQSQTPQQIEKLLQRAIDQIYLQYPPAKGLSSEHDGLIKKLKELQTTGFTKVNFKHETILLKSQNKDKQEEVQKIITSYAQIAEQCKEAFQQLVKSTCLEKCVYFKIGLKYYPKKPNPKAITRIKEKMYFKKDSNIEKAMPESKIKAVLDREQLEYKSQIDRILQQKDKVDFAISDMVRGKCVFLQIADIIYTVNQIKQFVANNSRYGIAQVECRFTNPTPISDVTLKIVLDNKIVAELQLTIQTNAASYSFSHKIYELQRTKVFSKLKIIHNYFQESRQEFNQLVQKSLEIQATKSCISLQTRKSISEYFKIDSKYKPLKEILSEVLHDNQKLLIKLQKSVDPFLQDLMSVCFNIALGKWGKNIGVIINKALKNQQLSLQLKSVILSVFFEMLSATQQFQNMSQCALIKRQLESKIFLQEFLQQYFQIQQAFKYVKQNPRLYYRARQLEQIVFYKSFQFAPVYLKQTAFVNNLIIQENCLQMVGQLQQLFNFYFVARKEEDHSIYPLFSCYSQWLQSQITAVKGVQQLNSEIEIVQAQYLIESNRSKQAQTMLENSLKYFKLKQNYKKVMDCEILLTECKIKTCKLSLKQSNDDYKMKVLQKANILGLELKGIIYTDSLWRIQNIIWERYEDEKEKQQILQSFTKRALEQMSRSKGKQFLYAIIKRWPEYEKNGMQKPGVIENNSMKYVMLSNIGVAESECLSKAGWKSLTFLNLRNNTIGEVGCQHLGKADWNNLSTLNLKCNNIGDKGCGYLKNANWKNLTSLDLSENNISSEGCKLLSQASWTNLTTLDLYQNSIGDKGCEYLSQADWKNITTINLRNNNIGALGCEHLAKADWKNMATLNLWENSIKGGGCEQLSKADWRKLTHLQLYSSSVGAAGCKHLSMANWKNLTQLDLWENNIRDKGCEQLSKGDWKHLTFLNLWSNNIGAVGCSHLAKVNWTNLTNLNLQENNIGEVGCQYLCQIDWKNMNTLNLNQNKIGPQGCKYLSKANWRNIVTLQIFNNNIGALGCQHLKTADWSNLTTLNLRSNNIGAVGCEHLSQTNWKKITTLDLYQNNIGDAGCNHIKNAEWTKMKTLNLARNRIEAEGCSHLSKAIWRHLSSLDLSRNKVGAVGCAYLKKADWKKITKLDIWSNNIGPAGCQYLSQANWKNITTLDLSLNGIGNAGCEHISKADWKNIEKLELNTNEIAIKGCQHLSKANWNRLKCLLIGGNYLEKEQEVKRLFSQKDLSIELN